MERQNLPNLIYCELAQFNNVTLYFFARKGSSEKLFSSKITQEVFVAKVKREIAFYFNKNEAKSWSASEAAQTPFQLSVCGLPTREAKSWNIKESWISFNYLEHFRSTTNPADGNFELVECFWFSKTPHVSDFPKRHKGKSDVVCSFVKV